MTGREVMKAIVAAKAALMEFQQMDDNGPVVNAISVEVMEQLDHAWVRAVSMAKSRDLRPWR